MTHYERLKTHAESVFPVKLREASVDKAGKVGLRISPSIFPQLVAAPTQVLFRQTEVFIELGAVTQKSIMVRYQGFRLI